ncbi:MAG: EamA family transporter [Firmicutes bacterium]|nr:EamA family transporter [Bacillota bacterium]
MKIPARAKVAFCMCIWGSIGIFRRYIPLSSAVLACARGLAGALMLLLYLKLRHEKLDLKAMGKAKIPVIICGVLMGINWILLFESYRYTSVGIATLCYYMEPVFVILASPLVFGEKLTGRKLICVACAFFGMFLVSGILGSGDQVIGARGVILGLGAGGLYAAIMMTNKRFPGISAVDRTAVQLGAAGAVLLPYILLTEDLSSVRPGALGIVMTLAVCLIHTGIAYVLYFSSIDELPVQTLAIMSYLDPVVALLLSVFLLREPFGIAQLIGAALILGAGYMADKE